MFNPSNRLISEILEKNGAYTGRDQSLFERKITFRQVFAINKPLDYIFIAASSLAVGLWSALIIRYSCYPRWVGYYGLLLLGMGIPGVFLRFNFIDLFGFRVFVFGLVSWIVIMGILMIRKESGKGEGLTERS